MKGFLLFILSIVSFVFIVPFGVVYALIIIPFKYGLNRYGKYFQNNAESVDQSANAFMSYLLNDILLKGDYYSFGNKDETISGVLGKNKLKKTLSYSGRRICDVLNWLDDNHVEKSIEEDEKN